MAMQDEPELTGSRTEIARGVPLLPAGRTRRRLRDTPATADPSGWTPCPAGELTRALKWPICAVFVTPVPDRPRAPIRGPAVLRIRIVKDAKARRHVPAGTVRGSADVSVMSNVGWKKVR